MNSVKFLIVFLIITAVGCSCYSSGPAVTHGDVDVEMVAGEGSGLLRPVSVVEALDRDWAVGRNKAVVAITYSGRCSGASCGGGCCNSCAKVSMFGHVALFMKLATGDYEMVHLAEDVSRRVKNLQREIKKAEDERDDVTRDAKKEELSGCHPREKDKKKLRVKWLSRTPRHQGFVPVGNIQDGSANYKILKFFDLSQASIEVVQANIKRAFYKFDDGPGSTGKAALECIFDARPSINTGKCLEFIEYIVDNPAIFTASSLSRVPVIEDKYIEAALAEDGGTPSCIVVLVDKCIASCKC
jgi:hypothetical protein